MQHRVGALGDLVGPVAEAEPRLRELAADGAHAVAVRRRVVPQRGEHVVEPALGARVVVGAHQREHLAVARLEQAREHLHAEEAGGAGQEDGRLHATASSRSGTGAVPMAWKPPSTCRISPVIARA